jgi:hypothetical protein
MLGHFQADWFFQIQWQGGAVMPPLWPAVFFDIGILLFKIS